MALLLAHLHDPSEPARYAAHRPDPLAMITALAQPPSSRCLQYTANRILDRLT
ncbi:hypothetical protein E4N62_16960 [Streptomyces sp. MNU76]|uniref:hypothetical protein n=1 Tax=Streptomyces sp. MNU76 TaxID=2560026 RepID=UPI001E364CD7|nr:hypothetical protein [Streptomyces sp. MNU76]MCC9706813.1 hypothetical protein [Streptomyces sp. MNU76]